MRIFRYLILLFTVLLWGGGLSSSLYHWLYKTGVIVDDYRYGDLYRLSALPQFKQDAPVCPPSNRSSDTASTHLYLIGDSFSEPQRLGKSDFRVSHFQRVAWEHAQQIQLDPNKRNVLLIESVERHFREHFAIAVNELVVEKDTNQTPSQQSSFAERWNKEFHRKDVDERLESALFSHNWAFWIKELKATLTLNWFDRAYTSVSLSKDKQSVFLHSDTDTSKVLNSSFSILTDREVNALVDSVNATADRYKTLGFDEVYLSLIPNKASILEPNRYVYNHLIERIQNNPRLKVPVVNTYDSFHKNATSVYLKSDTHWSCDGRKMWLALVQQKLGI